MNLNSDFGDSSDRVGRDTAVEERILQRMKQRTDEIALRSEKRRNEQASRNTELETADAFLAAFSEMKVKLEEDLLVADSLVDDRENLMKHFDKMVRDHALIQQYLNESNMFLAAFQVKTSQEILAELNVGIQAKMKNLQPKKRFGFKSKGSSNKEKKLTVQESSAIDETKADKSEAKFSALDALLLKKEFCGFRNISDETLVMEAEQIFNRQLNLQNLTNCTVIVRGVPGSIQAASLKNCTIIIGPTPRSAFIKDCKDCKFIVACQQVRIHDTYDTQFYLHVTGAVIIESCERVGFSPYNLEYPQLKEHYKTSGLNENINYWEKVNDFKWISENEKSPNFYIIKEDERLGNWL